MSSRSVNEAFRALEEAVRTEIASGGPPIEKRNLAQLLIDERETQRLSLQDVAERASLTKSFLWDIEAERANNPTVATVAAISSALGVSVLRVFQAALNTSKKKGRARD